MTDQELPRPKGIDINAKAPHIDTIDIYGNQINLYNLLNEYNGVLIDFFRGNW
ncbi:MAG: hypothetical protein ACFFA0_06815 [Promethearchaeota archaeon]